MLPDFDGVVYVSYIKYPLLRAFILMFMDLRAITFRIIEESTV